MEKPKAPKKPRKGDSPPRKFIEEEFLVCENYLYPYSKILEQEEEIRKTNEEWEDLLERLDEPMWVEDKFYRPSIEFLRIKEIKEELGTENFSLRYIDYEHYGDGWIVIVEKPNEDYVKQLEEFNNRFEKYEEDYRNYKEALKLYEKFNKEQKKQKLKKELEKLQ